MGFMASGLWVFCFFILFIFYLFELRHRGVRDYPGLVAGSGPAGRGGAG